jgi:hypothetical protein
MFNLAGVLLGGANISLNGNSSSDLYGAWRTLMQDRIFTPLNMTSSFVIPGSLANVSDVAIGHQNFLTGDILQGSSIPIPKEGNVFWDVNAAPAAGVSTSVGDFNKWLSYLLDRLNNNTNVPGYQFTSNANFQNLFDKLTVVNDYQSYGMGVYVRTFDNTTMLSHDGNKKGYRNVFCLFPEQNTAVAILMNADAGPMNGDNNMWCYDAAHAFLNGGAYNASDPVKYMKDATETALGPFTESVKSNQRLLVSTAPVTAPIDITGDYAVDSTTAIPNLDPILRISKSNSTACTFGCFSVNMISNIPDVTTTFSLTLTPWTTPTNFSVTTAGLSYPFPSLNQALFETEPYACNKTRVKGFSFLALDLVDFYGLEIKYNGTENVGGHYFKKI